MSPEEKIFIVLKQIKSKADISTPGTIIDYRAGEETTGLSARDEISILNKLEQDGTIQIIDNFSSDYE